MLQYFLAVAREQSISAAAEYLHITQPTLSHDMRVLLDAGIVSARKEWKNTYYSLNTEFLEQFSKTLSLMFRDKPDCICKRRKNAGDRK